MSLKIATLNLCLGLKNKKDLIKSLLRQNEIDILCMQETEIENGFNIELLRIPGFILELESNQHKVTSGLFRIKLSFICSYIE